MEGDERARFCGQCRKHVYNFSAMAGPEVEALVREKQGHLCGRYFQRADGRMLTADCPSGVARRRSRWKRFAGALCATLFFLIGRTVVRSQEGNKSGSVPPGKRGTITTNKPPVRALMGDIVAPQVYNRTNAELLGKIAVTLTPPRPLMGQVCVTNAASAEKPASQGEKAK
jgi:hypothetical protein